MKKILFLCCYLFVLLISSEQLIHVSESLVLNEKSLNKIRKSEKEAYKEYKKNQKSKLENYNLDLIESEKKPKSFTNEKGKIFINSNYFIQPLLKGQLNFVSIDGGSLQKIESPFKLFGEGEHKVELKSFDSNGNLLEEKITYYHLDSTRPLLSAHLEGHYIIKNSIPYFKDKVLLKIFTTDSGSGIDEVYVNINEKGFLPLKEVEAKIDSPGLKNIKIKSLDLVSNQSFETTIQYFVDNEAPGIEIDSSNITISGNETLFCEKNSRIKLSAHDYGVGIKNILYKKNNSQVWKIYKYKGFKIKKDFFLEFKAEDELGNKTQIKSFSCKVRNEDLE